MRIKNDHSCVTRSSVPYGELFCGLGSRPGSTDLVAVWGIRAYREDNGTWVDTFLEFKPSSVRELKANECSPFVLHVDRKFEITWKPPVPHKLISGNRDYGEVFITVAGVYVSMDGGSRGMEYCNLRTGEIVKQIPSEGFWVDKFDIQEVPQQTGLTQSTPQDGLGAE